MSSSGPTWVGVLALEEALQLGEDRAMKRLLVVFTLVVLLLAACGGTSPSGTGGEELVDLGRFKLGEPVTFRIKDTVYVCSESLPYSIAQVTDGGERRLMLQHSCLGIAGVGIDQVCKDGQVKSVDVIYCSDAIFCEDQTLDQEVVWDQQEYVRIGEECAGQTIHREVRQQVPSGQYQVVVSDWKEDHVESRIIAEFVITSD